MSTTESAPNAISPSGLRALLRAAIPAKRPVLIEGAPGVGKSDTIAAVAQELGMRVIETHAVTSDPTDVKGLPFASGGDDVARFLPFGDLAEAIGATEPTLWVLEDFGQATPAVQAGYMQLLLSRRVAGHALPDCVSIVIATNRRRDRAGVHGVLQPVRGRCVAVTLEPSLNDWVEWAEANGVDPMVIAFIRCRPDALEAFDPDSDASPTPRNWVHAAEVLSFKLDKKHELAALTGCVGAGAAAELRGFVRAATDMPDPDEIIADPSKGEVPTRADIMWALTTALSARCDTKNFEAIAEYAARVDDAGQREFAVHLLRDSVRRCPAAAGTPAFARAADSPLGESILGG